MLEFHSTSPVSKQIEVKYRSIFALIEAAIWGTLPDGAVQCVFVGRSSSGCHEYETRFFDCSGEAHIDWAQEVVSERVMTLVAELRSLAPVEDENGDTCRFRAALCEQGSPKAEFLCLPDMVEADTEIFMCRVRRLSASEIGDVL